MTAVGLYVSVCRLIVQPDQEDRESADQLRRLLPRLKKALTCSVCARIVSDPMTSKQHSNIGHCVCSSCITRRPKGNRATNVDYKEDNELRTVLLCLRKLGEYVMSSLRLSETNEGLLPTAIAETFFDLVQPKDEGGELHNGKNNSLYSVLFSEEHMNKIMIMRKYAATTVANNVSSVNNSKKNGSSSRRAASKGRGNGAVARTSSKKGCRCGNATLTPGKLTCCGQRCPCYVNGRGCTDCRCRGCRNPRRVQAKRKVNTVGTNNLTIVEKKISF